MHTIGAAPSTYHIAHFVHYAGHHTWESGIRLRRRPPSRPGCYINKKTIKISNNRVTGVQSSRTTAVRDSTSNDKFMTASRKPATIFSLFPSSSFKNLYIATTYFMFDVVFEEYLNL